MVVDNFVLSKSLTRLLHRNRKFFYRTANSGDLLRLQKLGMD